MPLHLRGEDGISQFCRHERAPAAIMRSEQQMSIRSSVVLR